MIHAFDLLERILQVRFVSSVLVLCISFFSVSSVVFGRAPNGIQPILDFGKKVEHARQELLDVYYDQVKQGLFTDASYVNSLVVDVDLENDAEQNVVILLRLINWLEQKNDRNSEFLLNKIGRLYFLELHQFLSSLDIHNPEVSSLIGHFHDICMLQLETPTGTIYPFRTSIAKMSLSIFMINHSHLPYQQRKESIFYALEQVKKELIGINHSLGYRGVQDSSIQSLIYLMGRFAIQEPLIPKRFLGKIVGWSVVVVLGMGTIYWALNADWTRYGEKLRKEIVKPITSKIIVDIINGVLDDATILSEKAADEQGNENGENNQNKKTIRETIEKDIKPKMKEMIGLKEEVKKTRESIEKAWADVDGKDFVAKGVKNTVVGVAKGVAWEIPKAVIWSGPKAVLWDSWHKEQAQKDPLVPENNQLPANPPLRQVNAPEPLQNNG